MYTQFLKEIRGFFSSVTGFLVVIVFILLNSSFMWIFKGENNVLENGYASLDSLFSLAPWLFLFLVPAVTMKMFAEEQKTGTLELLLTRPVSEWHIVLSKFFAAWALILISLIPTLIYFYSVYRLGNPVGNIDIGGTWGSYIGLLFLGGIYASIGIFASSLTDNQIVAFIIAVLLSFMVFIGFDLMAGIFENGQVSHLVEKMGIKFHYQSMARGVIDSRDLIYFLSMGFIMIYATRFVLIKRKW
ncbi:MAG: gliding motility-associated ABC transporter permease subunit GldF [Bacteroidales bacterium]|nr:gliding motility-associated ABC transporter permease subunit GldF [Bacteroidales bacterium]MCF8390150.1 gliding motility-associated ABC transporter permease subunit GldF [Bacteroidales bacterium]